MFQRISRSWTLRRALRRRRWISKNFSVETILHLTLFSRKRFIIHTWFISWKTLHDLALLAQLRNYTAGGNLTCPHHWLRANTMSPNMLSRFPRRFSCHRKIGFWSWSINLLLQPRVRRQPVDSREDFVGANDILMQAYTPFSIESCTRPINSHTHLDDRQISCTEPRLPV